MYLSNQEYFDKDELMSDNFNLKLVDYLENLSFIHLTKATFECPQNKSIEEIKTILHSSLIFEFKENKKLIMI